MKSASLPVGDEPRPDTLDRMVQLAGRLGEGVDFLRVDLYSLDAEVWFGELTPYPGGGVIRYEPREFDHELGAYWTLLSRRAVSAAHRVSG